MIKKISILLAFVLTFTNLIFCNNIAFADSELPNISAEYAVLMDYESGKVLYSKNEHSKMYPASTTKAWTAYVTIKHVKNLDEVITIGDIGLIDGTSMYLKPGEKFTVLELLQGMMVVSGNDAAFVLANYVSGSVEEFAKLMNKEAKAVGAKGTHFNNPHGLPDDNHYTTAYDMALMARKAMSNSTFRDIAKIKSLKFPMNENRQIDRHFINSNKLLTGNYQIPYKNSMVDVRYDIVDGIKTGYTDAAGKCLLSSARKDDMRLISSVFKAQGDNLYIDSRTLLDYGFENFTNQTAINKDEYTDSEKIWYSKERKLLYSPEYNYYTVINKDEKVPVYKAETKLNDIKLPIKKGDIVGNLEIYKDAETKPETKIKLIAQNDVTNIFTIILNNTIVKLVINLLLIILILLIVFISFVLFRKNKRKKIRLAKRKNIYSNKRKRR